MLIHRSKEGQNTAEVSPRRGPGVCGPVRAAFAFCGKGRTVHMHRVLFSPTTDVWHCQSVWCGVTASERLARLDILGTK